jgi:hypothetical protein
MAMLASMITTPSNGLVANKYMPETNPATPPNATAASTPSSHFVSSGRSVLAPSELLVGGGQGAGTRDMELGPGRESPTQRAA